MTVDQRRPAAARWWVVAAALVAGGFYGLFFAWPVAAMLWRGLDLGVLADVLGRSVTWRVLWFTLWQAVASTLLTLVVGLPIAHVVARYRFRGRGLLRAGVTVPFVLPTVVVASAFLSVSEVLGLDDDPVRLPGTAWAILAAHVFFNVAVVVRTVGGWWSQLDDRPEAAARTLGASPVRTFVEVTLPRLRPALAAASAIVFLFTFTSFGVVLILGGLRRATIETEIWRFATQRTDFETAAALGLVQLAVIVTMLLWNNRLQTRMSGIEANRSATQLERRPTTARERSVVAASVGLALLVLGLPLALLVERSFSTADGYGLTYYRALSEDGGRVPLLPVPAWTAVRNSLQWAVMATVIATVIGTAAAVVTAGRSTSRSSRGRPPSRFGRLVDIALLLPLGTSAVLVGFGMLLALDQPPFDFRARWWIVPVAQAVIGVPFVMRTVATSLRGIDPRLREAAATLGAPPRAVWREIDLPIAGRAIAVGAAFAFTVSVGEFGATTFLARPQRPTVPTAIFRLLGRPGELAFGQAMALSVILMVVTATAVLLMERLRTTVSGEF